MTSPSPVVGVIMGSDSDWSVNTLARQLLAQWPPPAERP